MNTSNIKKMANREKRKNSSRNVVVGSQGREVLEKLDDNSPVLKMFKKYSQELCEKQDTFERIVKLSRDINIESKRIIFLLHSIDRNSKKTSVLNEAESRLEALINLQFKSLAKELHNEDPYAFQRAFSPGMQEFIEAIVFFNFLKNDTFPHWSHYQDKLVYPVEGQPDEITVDNMPCSQSMILIPTDFILGLADVTGELMRKCINNLGEGDVEGCFKTCNVVRSLHSGFLTLAFFGNKEISHKMYMLKQSLLKMEFVCYNIHVRGTEIPKYMLADIDAQKAYSEEDEGFFG